MWRKIVILTVLLVLTGYLAVALTVFNRPSPDAVCSQVELKIDEQTHAGFITTQEVERLLQKGKLYPEGKRMNDIQCRKIEEYLAENPVIENVECYKSPTNAVCIEVTQRTPILRVMADNGEQYYLDSRGDVMPHAHYAAHLAVVTGAVTQKDVRALVYELGQYMEAYPFWKEQIEQIHITPRQELELVPRVGDHIIFLGRPRDIPEKLEKLKLFYIKGLNTVGWNKYSRISMEFTNQIICTQKEK